MVNIDNTLVLPDKTIEYVDIPLSEYEADFYKKIHNKILNEIKLFGGFDGISIYEILEHILRLRQATVHPQLVIDAYSRKYKKPSKICEIKYSSKMTFVVNTIKKEKRKTIIFCSFLKEMDMYETYLKEEGFKTGRIDGSVSPRNRIKISQSDDIDVIIVQIDAGGTGLNMTKFNRIFITSPCWHPCIEIQAIARALRIGHKEYFTHKQNTI